MLQTIILSLIGLGIYVQNYYYHKELMASMATQEERLQKIVEGVQTFKANNDQLKADNDAMKAEIERLKTLGNPDLEDELETLEGLVGSSGNAIDNSAEALNNVPTESDEENKG